MWTEATYWREIAKLACRNLAYECCPEMGKMRPTKLECRKALGFATCALCWEHHLGTIAREREAEGPSRE